MAHSTTVLHMLKKTMYSLKYQEEEGLQYKVLAYNTYMKNIDLELTYGQKQTFLKTYADT